MFNQKEKPYEDFTVCFLFLAVDCCLVAVMIQKK